MTKLSMEQILAMQATGQLEITDITPEEETLPPAFWEKATVYEHLGDGAYVSFDGHSFGFAANHHLNTSVVLGEREMLALARFVRGQYPGLAKAMSNLLKEGEQP